MNKNSWIFSFLEFTICHKIVFLCKFVLLFKFDPIVNANMSMDTIHLSFILIFTLYYHYDHYDKFERKPSKRNLCFD